jgi:hypothetical protein
MVQDPGVVASAVAAFIDAVPVDSSEELPT